MWIPIGGRRGRRWGLIRAEGRNLDITFGMASEKDVVIE